MADERATRTRDFVAFMHRSGVLTFGDFVAKSGRPTPYFVDAGRFRSAAQLAELGRFYAAAILDDLGGELDVVFGPAYKGIPLAVATGIALAERGVEVGVCFDRKEAKDHGEGGVLIGHRPRDGERVVIVEDVTTAGTSIRETVPLLRSIAAIELTGIVVGVDRRERGTRPDEAALDELGREYATRTIALATIDDVVRHLSDGSVGGASVLDADDLARIATYRASYGVA